jgi:hypothetical protein
MPQEPTHPAESESSAQQRAVSSVVWTYHSGMSYRCNVCGGLVTENALTDASERTSHMWAFHKGFLVQS